MLSFTLPDSFIENYKEREVNWGYSLGQGNSLGEITYITKYSRRKDDGTKERWYETCRRCIEGMYSILKDHCKNNRTPWNEIKGQKSAQEAYERMFTFKWTPPGRGLWMMGTEFVHGNQNSAPLQSCAFISTEKISSRSVEEAVFPFVRMMEMSMHGIGVGFDVHGAGKITLHQPNSNNINHIVIADTREGWCDSVGAQLESFFFEGRDQIEFDYSQIRPAGSIIRGLGGVSSGYDILEDLHIRLNKRLAHRAGQKLSSTDIADIMNLIGKAVVAGNIRRTAQIILGDASDSEYVNLKNWEVNPERMGADGWGNLSNNSVFASVGESYDHLIPNIIANGEPGLFYRDLARSYGRMIDPINNKDYRVAGVNPCQPGWARLLTPQGIRELKDIGIGDRIWSETGWTTVVNKWSTGVKDVNRYRTTTGVFYGTENHRLVSNGTKVEARDCESIDALVGPQDLILDKPDPQHVIDGLVLGDGSVHKASGDLVVLYIGNDDVDYFTGEVSDYITKYRPGVNAKAYEIETTIQSDELPNTYERRIPERYMTADPSTVAGFLRGLYSANGSVVSNRVTFKTASRYLVEDIQVLLSSLGIPSYYTTNRPATVTFANGEYECKESYDINISTHRERFANLIGFLQGYKNEKLAATLRGIGKAKTTYDIRSVEYVSTEEVFDITVSNDTHTYWTGGHNVSNCAEQSLEHGECCTLVETYISHHESYEDFARTLKFAYLYGKAVTLLPTHWPETNEVMQRNRRIGCSISGIVQFVESNGWTELRTWMNKGYKAVEFRDKQYSEWLGIRESIKTTSIKPSGTVSIVTGVTPGVHWPVADTYIRRMRLSAQDPIVARLVEAGYAAEPDVMDPQNTMVISLPTMGPKVRTEREVSVWEKAQLAIIAQRYWADNQVSVTLTFRPDEESLIGPLLHATEGQLKSISLLPLGEGSGKYAQMPYERISDEEYGALVSKVKPIDFDSLYAGDALDAEGERFCTNDTCVI